MRSNQLLGVLCTLTAICAFALVLTTCGGGRKQPSVVSLQSSDRSGGFQAADNPADDSASQSLDDALAELDALATPDGVDPELFQQLKDALASQLESRLSSRDSSNTDSRLENRDSRHGGKFVSTPPTGDANQVTDLAITDNGGGTYTLTWHYRNLGDYNQDGTVGISDITPLAAHFNEPADSTNEWIDGNADGVMNIQDVTLLAANFGVECTGYAVESSESESGPFTDFDSAPFSSASGEQRKLFSLHISPEPGTWLRVLPVDSSGERGLSSNLARVGEWHLDTLAEVSDIPSARVSCVVSLASVSGNPAMTYNDGIHGELRYVRATDPKGSSWATPVTIDSSADDFSGVRLAIVNGRPAISYCTRSFDWGTTRVEVRYTRASSPDGDSWTSPTTLYQHDSNSDSGVETSLAIVGGRPAICYTECYPSYKLRYRRATDSEGDTWGAPINLVEHSVIGPSLAVVNGNPAVAYSDMMWLELRYMRAEEPSGDSWGNPVAVEGEGVLGLGPSLGIVNGVPAISYCYYDFENANLKFARASDPDGESWEFPITLDNDRDTVYGNSLAVVNGSPAISYCDKTNGHLKYVRATDASGNTWGNLMTVDRDWRLGPYSRPTVSLAVVNGHPAISYLDGINYDLKFAIFY